MISEHDLHHLDFYQDGLKWTSEKLKINENKVNAMLGHIYDIGLSQGFNIIIL